MSQLELGEIPKFPENRHGLKDGSCIVAQHDMDFFGLKKGSSIPLLWDGRYVSSGTLTWSIEKICDEIDSGIWEIMSDEDARDLITAMVEKANTVLHS